MLEALSLKKQRTVLVVDDDAFSQSTLCESLSQLAPLCIRTALDGALALQMLQSGEVVPDVLICDIYMPNMDGMEFLAQLAELHFQGEVIVVSGVNLDMLEMASQIARSNGLHVAGAFLKPVTASQLSAALSLGCEA